MYGTAKENVALHPTVAIDRRTLREWEITGAALVRARGTGWTRHTIEVAVERVNRGALLLDREKPSWVEEVAPQRLNMSSGSWCIIGQTYGDYGYVGIPFGMQNFSENEESLNEKATEHGFMDNGVPFSLLDRVWVYLLDERRESGQRVILSVSEG